MSATRVTSPIVAATTVCLMAFVDVSVGLAFLIGFAVGLLATMAVGREVD